MIDGLNQLTDYDAKGILPGIDWTDRAQGPDDPTTGRCRPAPRSSQIDGEFVPAVRRARQAVHLLRHRRRRGPRRRPNEACRPEPPAAAERGARSAMTDLSLRHPGHPHRVRLRPAWRWASSSPTDLGRLQPGLRRPGLRLRRRLLRHPGPPRLADLGRRSCSPSSSSGPSSARPRPRPLPPPAHGASSIAKLVTSLGLLVAIPEIVKLWFGAERLRGEGHPADDRRDRRPDRSTASATTRSTATRWPRSSSPWSPSSASPPCSAGRRSACGCGPWSRARG